MFENPKRGRQAKNFTTNVPKILDLKSSSEQRFSENWRWVPLKSVRFSYSLFVSYYFKLLLFCPSRCSNCIDGLLIEKDNIIVTTFIEKIEWYLLKIRLNAYLNVNLINNVQNCIVENLGTEN